MALNVWDVRRSTAGVEQARLERTTQAIQLVTAAVLAPVVYLICLRLAPQVAWENGPLEMTQNFMLGFAAIASLAMAMTRWGHVQRYLWLAGAVFYLLLLGRELSWGAVLIDAISFDALNGPSYSSRALSYRPYIAPVGYSVFAVGVLLLALAKPVQLTQFAWLQRRLAPWGALLACLLYGLVATIAENGSLHGQAVVTNAQVIEEVFETFAYYFLLRAHWRAFKHWLKP